jgi:hypothetical protein
MNTATTKIAGEAMTKDQIRDIFMAHGFAIKEGQTDLKPYVYDAARALLASKQAVPFQTRVQPWMLECFGAEIAADRIERNHRFFEEATEAVQANGMTRCEAHQLVDYTFDRPVGELHQEIGGVMVTLAALCLASGQDMHAAGETELARIWTKVEAIRAKQAAKPKHSPLPTAPAQSCGDAEQADEAVTSERLTSAIDLMKRLKRDLMYVRRFSTDTLENYRRACSNAEGDVEEWLKEHAGTRAKDSK